MERPKSIFDIDKTIILSKNKPTYNSYDNKPLSKWNYDDFANYIFANMDSNNNVVDNYFSNCFKEYFIQLPNLTSCHRVYLCGIFSIIEKFLKTR